MKYKGEAVLAIKIQVSGHPKTQRVYALKFTKYALQNKNYFKINST